jgi:hypothetical protein
VERTFVSGVMGNSLPSEVLINHGCLRRLALLDQKTGSQTRTEWLEVECRFGQIFGRRFVPNEVVCFKSTIVSMCMVVYVTSRRPLPLLAWREDAPAFNVAELTESEERVRRYLLLPHVRQAGSHTSCGCGFNEGRQWPSAYANSEKERIDALESSRRLIEYLREYHVEQIYSCWSGDEGEPKEFERTVTPEELVRPEFFFRERELLTIVNVGC